MTEGLHSELSNTNVRVTVVFPGAIDTNIAANSGVRLSLFSENSKQQGSIKPLAPSKAAQIIIDGMEEDHYQILVGRDSAFMDFIYRVSLKHAAKLIIKLMQSLLPD